jgi:hypothetical protein
MPQAMALLQAGREISKIILPIAPLSPLLALAILAGTLGAIVVLQAYKRPRHRRCGR